MKKITGALAALLCVGVGTLALAGEGAQRHGRHHGRDGRMDEKAMLEKFDANKDGTLDDTEKAAARAAWKVEREARHADFMARFDANKDGKLDDAERDAAKAEWTARGEKREADMLAKYDANKDGKLDDTERQAMRDGMKQRHDELVKQFDANGDGTLDDTERAALRKSMPDTTQQK